MLIKERKEVTLGECHTHLRVQGCSLVYPYIMTKVIANFPCPLEMKKMPLISLRDRISQWRNTNRKMMHENVRKHTGKKKKSSNPDPFLTTICLMWGIIMGLSTRFWFLLVQHWWKHKTKSLTLNFYHICKPQPMECGWQVLWMRIRTMLWLTGRLAVFSHFKRKPFQTRSLRWFNA